jgi:hypothetical protein
MDVSLNSPFRTGVTGSEVLHRLSTDDGRYVLTGDSQEEVQNRIMNVESVTVAWDIEKKRKSDEWHQFKRNETDERKAAQLRVGVMVSEAQRDHVEDWKTFQHDNARVSEMNRQRSMQMAIIAADQEQANRVRDDSQYLHHEEVARAQNAVQSMRMSNEEQLRRISTELEDNLRTSVEELRLRSHNQKQAILLSEEERRRRISQNSNFALHSSNSDRFSATSPSHRRSPFAPASGSFFSIHPTSSSSSSSLSHSKPPKSRDSPPHDEAAKRKKKSEQEKERRNKIGDMYDEICRITNQKETCGRGKGKISKDTVLSIAIDHLLAHQANERNMKAEMRRLSDENRQLKLQLSGDGGNTFRLQLGHQQMPQIPAMRSGSLPGGLSDVFSRDHNNSAFMLNPNIAHSGSDDSESGIDNSSIRPSTNYERKSIHTRKRRRVNSKEDFAEAANFFFDANNTATNEHTK